MEDPFWITKDGFIIPQFSSLSNQGHYSYYGKHMLECFVLKASKLALKPTKMTIASSMLADSRTLATEDTIQFVTVDDNSDFGFSIGKGSETDDFTEEEIEEDLDIQNEMEVILAILKKLLSLWNDV